MARNERQMLLPKARRRLDTGSEVEIEMGYQGFSSNWLTVDTIIASKGCIGVFNNGIFSKKYLMYRLRRL